MIDFACLQKQIRSDPDGYRSEFLQQLRHYEASLAIFTARPNEPSKEFVALVRFIASVSDAYSTETRSFVVELMQLLEKNYEILDKSLRKALVQSLMQLRQRKRVDLMELLPLLFRLFGCKDKALRLMVFTFIVSDIKASNRNVHGPHQLNRQMKGFLLNKLRDDNEAIAKKALAILTDLWRRQVWHDVHTANVIASAVHHANNTVMYAAVKFFLGYDLKECEDDDDEAEAEKINREAQLSTEDVYRAQKKGTRTSKKKKMKKLKRVKTALMRQARKNNLQLTEQFAAIQLLQDPYKIAEVLFSRARSGKVTAQTRLAIVQLLSRIVSVHRLVVLNFYPYLQKYLFPGNRDVLTILAALVEGCHEMIPPDALECVLRQLVDRFIHDHARPEVITLGLKTVREMCSRAPLIMRPELLSDLILYRKFKDAEVRAAAKGLVSLFRDIAPQMLPKKERGRGSADDTKEPLLFGQHHIHERLEGADLLERERQAVTESQSSHSQTDPDSESTSEEDLHSDTDSKSNVEDVSEQATCALKADPTSLASLKKQLLALKQKETEQEAEQNPKSIQQGIGGNEDFNEEEISLDTSSSDEEGASSEAEDASLKDAVEDKGAVEETKTEDEAQSIPLEMKEILGDDDFQRLHELKREEAVNYQLKKVGLLPGTERSSRLREAAEADADEMLKQQASRTHISETGLNPTELAGKARGKANKTERMLSVLRGREDATSHEAKAANKKRKTGGLSNKEKIKRKNLPLKGRMAQARKRRKVNAVKHKGKNFKGHVKKH